MRSLVLSLLVILSGCGGGGGGASQPAPPQNAAVPQAVLIEAYGDSTMYGTTYANGAFVQAEQPVPAILQALLREKYGPGVTVANRGVPGSTAPVLLTGYGDNLPWAQQMAQSKAQIVYFNYGINDAFPGSNEPPEAFANALKDIIRIAREAGKTVVVETANPVADAKYSNLPDYVAMSLAVASAQGVPSIDQHKNMLSLDWQSLMSDAMKAHPTQAGYWAKARYAFPTLDEMVGVALSR